MQTKITLDTNCIINLLDNNSTSRTSYESLRYILTLADRGIIAAFVTTRFSADQANDTDGNRVREIASKLAELPIDTIGAVFRYDLSTLNGGDFYGNDEIIDISNKLTNLLSPSGLDPSSNTFSNRLNDIDHLTSHYQSGNDIFITDDVGILKKANSLEDLLGIIVMSPDDLVRHTRDHNIAKAR